MASFLSFLQQSMGLTPDEPPVDPNQIVVTGGVPEDERTVVPTNYDTLDRTADVRENAPPRKGMFGVKGTLRDVLGTLGDAFLVGGGGDLQYRPWREREMQADAAADFTSNPLAAIERLSAAGFTKEAADLYNDYQMNAYRDAQLNSIETNRADQRADRKFTNVAQATTQLQRILANATSPEQQQRLLQFYGPLLAERAGVTPQDLGIFDGMTPEDIEAFAKGDMTVNQVMNYPLAEKRVGIAQQNADTAENRAVSARISATRPRNTPNPTSASMASPIIQKALRGEELSPTETEVLDRLGYEIPKSGRRRGGSGRAAPPGGTPAPSGWTVTRRK